MSFFCYFSARLIDEVVDLLIGAESHVITVVGGGEAFLGGGAEPFQLGFVFLLALLQEPRNYEETTAAAIKRVLARQVEVAMKAQNVSKAEMAKRMHTSRAA